MALGQSIRDLWKREPLLTIAGALVAGSAVLAVVALGGSALVGTFGAGSRDRALGAALSADFAPLPIDPEELLLPPEPDFIPRVRLARERRASWTLDDAAAYWTDPASLDPAPLDAAARSAVAAIWEAVP